MTFPVALVICVSIICLTVLGVHYINRIYRMECERIRQINSLIDFHEDSNSIANTLEQAQYHD